jgi:hypothetical protein
MKKCKRCGRKVGLFLCSNCLGESLHNEFCKIGKERDAPLCQNPRQLVKTTDNVVYDASDTCVCCGAYLPEGYGMVCDECLKKEREKSFYGNIK